MVVVIKLTSSGRRTMKSLRNMRETTIKGIRQGFYNAGKDLRKTASDNILKRGRGGKVYKIKGRRHTASIAGESAANISGTYRRSIGFQVSGGDHMIFSADAPYAGFLEFGTNKIKPRPALQISIQANEKNIENHLEREIIKAFKKH